MCHVPYNFQQEFEQRDDPLNQEQRSYEMPNGDRLDVIEVNHHKRITAAEILFDPSLISKRADYLGPAEADCKGGIARIAYESIDKCDSDLRVDLYNNIVLAGGTTMMKGFVERFEYEMKKLAEHTAKTEININASLTRDQAAWIGGSMLSSMSTFGEMTIKSSEYLDTQPESERYTCILKKTVY